MDAQITCQQCGKVITQGKVFAVRIKQSASALCEECINAIPKSIKKLPAESRLVRTIQFCFAMQNAGKPGGVELTDPQFRLSSHDFELCFPLISSNGNH